MKLVLCTDDTLSIDLPSLAEGLNAIAPAIDFVAKTQPVSIPTNRISNPTTYDQIEVPNQDEYFDAYRIIIASEKTYDNNHFFDYSNKEVIISFSGWSSLTELPVTNGFVFFIAQLIADGLGVGRRHKDRNRGCIQDFMQDKRGVDTAMRAAFVCAECKANFDTKNRKPNQVAEFQSLISILDSLSQASRSGRDILSRLRPQSKTQEFDVFLCHNSLDKDEVRKLNESLKEHGIKPWLDEEQLPPGRPWQDLLEKQIETITSAAICVGNNGIGPWQDVELRGFLQEFVRRGSPVIPVILPDCTDVPNLPLFLRQFTWVDLRRDGTKPLSNLVWGITGQRPD